MKLKKYFRIFMEGDEGGGFGSEGGGLDPGSEGEGSSAPPAAPARVQFDPESMKQFGSVIAEQFKSVQPKAPKTYSPEEIAEARKALKFWEPDDAFIQEFGNLETQKSAFAKLRDNQLNMTVEVVKAMLAEQNQSWEQKFTPVQKLIEQRNQQEQIARFESTYPALANPKLSDFRESVGQKLAAAGAFNGKSESEAFDILAKAMEDTIKSVNPEFTLGERAPSARSVRNSNAISPSASGSGGGGSGGGNGGGDGAGVKLPKGASLFAKIRG